MKKVFISLILAFIVASSFAQSKSEIVVGKNILSDTDILATKYEFHNHIYGFYIDTMNNNLTLLFRDVNKKGKWSGIMGTLVQYDLKNIREKWSKDFNYQTSRIQQYEDIIFLTAGRTIRIDAETGEEMGKIKYII